MPEHLQVSVTTDDRTVALGLARSAISARLAACAQVGGPVTSLYRWHGAVQEASEWTVTLKTTAARFPELAAHLRREHGYETPEIIAVPIVAGDADYLAWVSAESAPDVAV